MKRVANGGPLLPIACLALASPAFVWPDLPDCHARSGLGAVTRGSKHEGRLRAVDDFIRIKLHRSSA